MGLLFGLPAFGQSVGHLQSPMFSHFGAEEEAFQNPAACLSTEGLTAGIGLFSQTASEYFIVPLPAGLKFAYNNMTWGGSHLYSVAMATRWANTDTADGYSFGMNMKWDSEGAIRLIDPGLQYRNRLESRGDEINLGVYTFGFFGERKFDRNADYQNGDPVSVPTELVFQGAWISPSRFWELSGSLEALTDNGSAPGIYRYAYPFRHLEAAIRPMPWFKLACKVTDLGIREYRFEGDWRYGGIANRIKFQMAGYRNYYGYTAVATRLQLSLFGNWGKAKS